MHTPDIWPVVSLIVAALGWAGTSFRWMRSYFWPVLFGMSLAFVLIDIFPTPALEKRMIERMKTECHQR